MRRASSRSNGYQVARSILSFLRAVPDIVFALVFVTAAGLGPFPRVLAILLHNVGVMGNLWAVVDRGDRLRPRRRHARRRGLTNAGRQPRRRARGLKRCS